ncbi:hypothetical protein KJP30_09990 [Mameliella sp. DP3N28-2]|nr:hypothetical protein [Mameliella sediminis]
MLVGATIVRRAFMESLYDRMQRLREEHSMFAELKWSKISNQKIEAYRAFVDLFFEFTARGAASFRATTFDNHMWDHNRFNDGDADIGVSKLYYQMLLHQVIGWYGDVASLYICLDRRLSTTPLEKLQRILNAGAAKDYKLTFGPVRILTARDSKKEDLLQLNDIILGAVASYKNKRHLETGARAAKVEIANYVFERSGLKSYDTDSPKSKKDFQIWNRKPRK